MGVEAQWLQALLEYHLYGIISFTALPAMLSTCDGVVLPLQVLWGHARLAARPPDPWLAQVLLATSAQLASSQLGSQLYVLPLCLCRCWEVMHG